MASPSTIPVDEPTGSAPSPSLPRRFFQLLYTHNPFYLLSVGCVVHGASYWMQTSGGYRAWPLVALVSGYILLLAGVAWAIVRVGQVWEDARSIFLILLLMFVELSLTLDDPLLTAPSMGVPLVFAGFLFVAAVVEGLLHGLHIRLPWLLRLPFYVLLGLMMLYPLALIPIGNMLLPEQISWRIYGFFPLVGAAMLALIPAIRTGAGNIRDSGTPWQWPWHPWTIFAALLGAVCVRGYAFSLSFDPVLALGTEAAMRLESAWGWYYLAPVVLALGWLILEFGIVLNHVRLQRLALLFPLLSVGISIPLLNASAAFEAFLTIFTRRAGSPMFLCLIGAFVFYGLAFLRRVAWSDLGLALTLSLLAVVDPNSLGWTMIANPSVLPLGLACVFLVVRGYALSKSLQTLAGLLLGIAALRFSLPTEWPGVWQNALSLHLLGSAMLLVGARFHDALSKFCLAAAAGLLLAGVLSPLYGKAYFPSELPDGVVPGYVGGLIVFAFVLAYWLCSRLFFVVGILNLGAACSEFAREAYFVLRHLPEWPGIASFGLAFLLLAIGGAISAAKAGMLDRLKSLIPRQSLEAGQTIDSSTSNR